MIAKSFARLCPRADNCACSSRPRLEPRGWQLGGKKTQAFLEWVIKGSNSLEFASKSVRIGENRPHAIQGVFARFFSP